MIKIEKYHNNIIENLKMYKAEIMIKMNSFIKDFLSSETKLAVDCPFILLYMQTELKLKSHFILSLVMTALYPPVCDFSLELH
jgi:hypothetical protein